MRLTTAKLGGVPALAFRGAALGSVGLTIGLWVHAKTVDQGERGNAERRALFVGLWPPMLWLFGDWVERVSGVHVRSRR